MAALSAFEVEVLVQFKKHLPCSSLWLILINIMYVFNQWNRCIYYVNFETKVIESRARDGLIPWEYPLCLIFSGALALLVGILADLYGRRIIALILTALWLSFAAAQVAVMRFKGTYLMHNFALTMAYSTSQALVVPVFVNFVEIMPIRLRLLGMLDSCWDYTAVLFVRMIAHLIKAQWRQEMVFTFCIVFVMLSNWYIPESPFWLMNKGKISRLFSVVKDATGKQPEILSPPDAEQPTGNKWKIVQAMFLYLFKTQWKRFLFCVLLGVVCSGMRSDAKWKIDFDKSVPSFPRLAVLLNACTLPLLLVCYYIFGVRLGLITILFVLFVLNLVEMVTLMTSDDIMDEIVHHHPFQYLLSDTSETIVHLYAIEIFPTPVRATLFSIMQVVRHATRLLLTILNVNKLASNFVFYAFRTILPLVGLLPVLMPETRKLYLPNEKIQLSPST